MFITVFNWDVVLELLYLKVKKEKENQNLNILNFGSLNYVP